MVGMVTFTYSKSFWMGLTRPSIWAAAAWILPQTSWVCLQWLCFLTTPCLDQASLMALTPSILALPNFSFMARTCLIPFSRGSDSGCAIIGATGYGLARLL